MCLNKLYLDQKAEFRLEIFVITYIIISLSILNIYHWNRNLVWGREMGDIAKFVNREDS
mgnify:CR=1 FL=1